MAVSAVNGLAKYLGTEVINSDSVMMATNTLFYQGTFMILKLEVKTIGLLKGLLKDLIQKLALKKFKQG